MPYIIPNVTAIPQAVSATQIIVNGTTHTWPSDRIVEGVKVIHHIECSIGTENTGAVPAELKFTFQRDIGSGWEDVAGEVACYTIAAGDDARRKANFKVPYYTGISGFVPRYRLLAECPAGEVTLHRAEGRDAVPTVTGKQEHEFDGNAPVVIPLWGPIPDTGQTVQYLPGDDADYGWDYDENDDSDGHAGLKYTKFDASGSPLPPGASSWEAVRDDRSGLFYRIAGIGSGTWNDTMTWASEYAGLGKTWRLATTQELLWLVDFSRAAGKLDPMVSALSGNARALTENQTDNTLTWMVNFSNGNASGTAQKNDGLTQYLVIYVSGNQLTPSFQDNGDGTITDASTGFMWTKYFLGGEGGGDPTALDWYSAVPAALACSVGGYSDWRMPNLKELSTIIDYQYSPPGINTSVFPVVPASSILWTSTSYIGATINAWTFTLRAANPRDNGMSFWFNKTLGFIYAIAVRNA